MYLETMAGPTQHPSHLCNLIYLANYHVLSHSKMIVVLPLDFHIYVKVDDDEYRHIYKTNTLIII